MDELFKISTKIFTEKIESTNNKVDSDKKKNCRSITNSNNPITNTALVISAALRTPSNPTQFYHYIIV